MQTFSLYALVGVDILVGGFAADVVVADRIRPKPRIFASTQMSIHARREAEGVRLDEWGALQYTDDTLSVSPFGLPALPEGEPRALRAKAETNGCGTCILPQQVLK